eukprot:bmy_11924T0
MKKRKQGEDRTKRVNGEGGNGGREKQQTVNTKEKRDILKERAGGLRPRGRAGLLGRDSPGDWGRAVCLVGNVGQRGNPLNFLAFKITSSERFQFRPVSAQLRPSAARSLRGRAIARSRARHGAPLQPLAALCGERPAPVCPAVASWRRQPSSRPQRVAAQRDGEVPGSSCSARVCPLAWLLDLGTRPPPLRP